MLLGPRGDGYDPGQVMSETEAEAYHSQQIGVFRETEVDLVTAITITNTPEAIGIVRAARSTGLPVVISFTLETDGCLPTGQSLREAIDAVDAATDKVTAYYMINCAHPIHFDTAIATNEPWITRLRGIRANASKLSHHEPGSWRRLAVRQLACLNCCDDFTHLVINTETGQVRYTAMVG